MTCPAYQDPAVLEATATGHAMLALHTAERLRLKHCEAADGETAPSNGSGAASRESSQSSSRGSARGASKQSAKGRKGPDASFDKEDTWQCCLEHAHAAAQAWQGCLHGDAVEGASCDGLADADLLAELMLELLFMAGLHGETLFLPSSA